MAEKPFASLNEINVISTEEVEFIRNQYNDTDVVYEQDLLLQSLFERQAAEVPEQVALIFEEKQLTYKELNEKSNQVAYYLRQQGITAGDSIGVVAARCFETIINVLGVLKSGAAYIPISEDAPVQRREDILKQSKSKLLLERNLYESKHLKQYPSENGRPVSRPDDIAYVIFTSGSTGKPKGVAITHKAAVNTLQDINAKFHVCNTDCVLAVSSLCFDLSVYDIFGTLSAGAKLVLIHDQRDALEMKECLIQHQVTVWNSVPAIMNMLAESFDDNTIVNDLRLVMLSGDWIPLQLPRLMKTHFPKANQISLGGATEASIWSIYYPISKVQKSWKSIPYGYPLGNQKYYVLDEGMGLCPIGVPGELYIGGIGVAAGYINDEERTKAAFISTKELGRLYKTGDYGVLHSEGYIEFLGRRDNQVKIRGYRIELGEIEATLQRHPKVHKALVSDFRDQNNKQHLCAYIVPETVDCKIDFQDYLAQYLPDYMVPGFYIQVDQFPLSSNGKVDKKALPKPDFQKIAERELQLPANRTEQDILDILSEMQSNRNISTKESLFQLGMDSVAITLLVVKIYKKFKVQVPLQKIFQTPTIAAIAKFIEDNQNLNHIFDLLDLSIRFASTSSGATFSFS